MPCHKVENPAMQHKHHKSQMHLLWLYSHDSLCTFTTISVAYGPYLTELTHPTPSPVKLHWMQHSCEGVHAVYEMVPGGPCHSRKGQAVCAWLQHSLPLLAARNPTQEQPPAAERSGEDRSTIAYGKERSSARSKKRV